MNKNQAIKILNKQKDKLKLLKSSEHHLINFWVSQTEGYIVVFFGKDSLETGSISKMCISRQFSKFSDEENEKYINEDFIRPLLLHMDIWIEKIKDIGIFKPLKKNFTQLFSNAQIIAGAFCIITTISSFAFYIGTQKVDVDKIKYMQENIKLKDSLLYIKSLPDIKPTGKNN
jgi:hypothetical protein